MGTTVTPDLSISTPEHPNVTRTRAAFAAFARGDLDAVREHFATDATWTNGGSSVLAGTFRGWDEIVGMFGALFEATGGTYRNDLVSVVADDTTAVAVYDATSTIGGQEATERFVLIDELTPDGRVRATRNLAYDQGAADAHLAHGIPKPR
jgi:ketosteroid isomerase-like protein